MAPRDPRGPPAPFGRRRRASVCSRRRLAAACVLCAGLWGGAAMAAAARFPSLVEMLPACAFRGLTGLPCPTCGTSRALLALGRGDLAGALAVQPFVTALAALFALLLLWSAAHVAAPGCVPMAFPPPARQVVAVRAGAFALLVNWVYLLTIGQ